MISAYAHLNLRANPFGELAPHHRAQLAVADLDPILTHLERPRTAVQLVGRCGRGKSTHLHALRHALPDAHHARLWSDRPDPSALSGTVLLDEFDAVGLFRRARLVRAATRVVVGVHRSHALELRAQGFDVATVPVASDDPARLRQILSRRIEFARLDAGPVPTITPATARTLTARFGDDVRQIESVLFDAIHAMTEVRDVQV